MPAVAVGNRGMTMGVNDEDGRTGGISLVGGRGGGMSMWRPEPSSEGHVILGGQGRLVAEEQDTVLEEGLVNGIKCCPVDPGGQIDVSNLSTENR